MINQRICLRKDRIETWTSLNPVLLDGEIGLVLINDEYEQIVIGDGKRAFNSLPKINLPSYLTICQSSQEDYIQPLIEENYFIF